MISSRRNGCLPRPCSPQVSARRADGTPARGAVRGPGQRAFPVTRALGGCAVGEPLQQEPRSVFRLSAENVPEPSCDVPGIVPQSEILKTEKLQSHILCEAASHLFSLFYPHLKWLSCYAMSCDPVGCSPRGSSVRGILQARVENGLPLPSPGDLPEQVSCIAGGFLTS